MYYRFDPRPKINLALYRNRVQGELKVSYEKEINDFVERNRDEILQVLSELVQIRTENIPPSGNEKKGQEYLYNKLTEFIPEKDIEVFDTDEIEGIKEHPLFFPTIDGMKRRYKGRPNLVATLRGRGGGSSLVLSGHVDTVPAGEEHWKIFDDPFSGKIKNGKLYGRGSMDMKGGLVASLFAIKCITELGLGLKGDVFFESVVDEEYGGVNGTLACRLRYPNIDFAILSEPSGLVSGIETRGGSVWKISIKESGEGGITPIGYEIPNPIYKLSKVAISLEKYNKERNKIAKVPDAYEDNPFLPLLTFLFYAGGKECFEVKGVPTEAHLYFWVETFAGMEEDEVMEDLIGFMHDELNKYQEFRNNFPNFERVTRYLSGHRTDRNHPALNSLRRSFKAFGIDYIKKGVPHACDAFSFKLASKTDVVVLGPKGSKPHGLDEYVEVESVMNLIKIMAYMAIDYSG